MAEKGQFPKAYLRMDPNIDTHPDFEGMVLLMCAANRQHPRGRFNRPQLLRLLGRKRLQGFLEVRAGKTKPDLLETPDGLLYLEGWDEWQEGDWTVGERVARLRAKRNATVTSTVTPPLPERTQALGVGRKARNNDPPYPPAHAGGPTGNGNGNGHHGRPPLTKGELDAAVRRLSDYWRWLASIDPRAPNGLLPRPVSFPGESNTRVWAKGLRKRRISEDDIRESIASRVYDDLVKVGVPVWDVEPWPPPDKTEERSE